MKPEVSGSNVSRLYASRNFEFGDAITFFSKYEERSGESVLGGLRVRIVDSPSECNSYLTENRTLRCSKAVREGDEITRCVSTCDRHEMLEHVDLAVLCLDKMEVGRVGSVCYPAPRVSVCLRTVAMTLSHFP